MPRKAKPIKQKIMADLMGGPVDGACVLLDDIETAVCFRRPKSGYYTYYLTPQGTYQYRGVYPQVSGVEFKYRSE